MWEDFDENDWDESDESDFQNEKDKVNSNPLMLKAIDIIKLTSAITGSLDEARKQLYGPLMLESAGMLASKFSAANQLDDYVLKMENAVTMKIHARNLHAMTYQLANESTHAEEHLQLLRDSLEDFKKLFVVWVKTFDRTKRSADGWGLFED